MKRISCFRTFKANHIVINEGTFNVEEALNITHDDKDYY